MSGTVSVTGDGFGAEVVADSGFDLTLGNSATGGMGLDAVDGGFCAGLSVALLPLAAMLL